MKLFGLIGYPLGHSFSKKYFDKKIEDGHLIDCSFELFPLKKIENYLQIKESDSNLQGLAVTIP
ncbi:MAG: shikimate dehydrogenase, partial [Ferruginibacter sp.]